MKIQIRHQYQASPERVAAMLTDETFLQMVATEVGATSQQVTKTADGAQLKAAVAAPSEVKRFVGDSFAVVVDLTVRSACDSKYLGDLRGEVERMPAKMSGSAQIEPSGAGSEVVYDIEFSVNVPLVGRKLEQAAEPQVRQIIDVQQRVGERYLAERD